MNKCYEIRSMQNTQGLRSLLQVLQEFGYIVIAARHKSGVLELQEITSVEELPFGFGDKQEKATYNAVSDANESFFGYHLGPKSWKSYLFPPERVLWKVNNSRPLDASVTQSCSSVTRYAFLGMRACEASAVAIQDKVFLRGQGEPYYRAVRDAALFIGVHCGGSAPTCFCASMGTGPGFTEGAVDLLLTEVTGSFLVEAVTQKGDDICARLPLHKVDEQWARRVVAGQIAFAASEQVREVSLADLKNHVSEQLNSPQWSEIGERCLACANCTAVCPTCFCSTVEDTQDFMSSRAERRVRWDSCFNADFSYVHGGNLRPSTASKYRQWFSHKFSTWYEQFGSSGCVGCGRCITWCPVGIDITEEAKKLQQRAKMVVQNE